MPTGKQKPVTIEAEYRFKQDELLELGQNLASKQQELGKLESSKKNYNSQIKSEIDAVDSEITLLAQKISTGKEFRDFLCNVEFDMESKIKTYIDVETGDVIKSMPMSAYDLQAKLDLDEEDAEEGEEEEEETEQLSTQEPSVDADDSVVEDDPNESETDDSIIDALTGRMPPFN